jgi:hypothetical protein
MTTTPETTAPATRPGRRLPLLTITYTAGTPRHRVLRAWWTLAGIRLAAGVAVIAAATFIPSVVLASLGFVVVLFAAVFGVPAILVGTRYQAEYQPEPPEGGDTGGM